MKRLTNGILGVMSTVVLTAGMAVLPASAAQPPPAQRPPMGYNTWYQYRTNLSEAEILRQAQLLVSSGLARAGYNLMSLDDGWLAPQRTADGALTWNAAKFPHGIPWLASQIHSLGLKFGIYGAIGTRTCQNLPGSWSHYKQDAQEFAEWGTDFVKVDECGGLPTRTTTATLTQNFQDYGADLRAANPSEIYSAELPIYQMGKPGFLSTVKSSASFANMWRVTPDENYTRPASTTIIGHLAADLHLHAFAGPGHWNDLDMILPGRQTAMPFDWTLAQQESQLSVWAIEASPLLMSTDIATLTSAELAALKNPQMIAIDQSGTQAAKAVTSGHVEAVIKAADGGTAVLFANLGAGTASAQFTLAQFGLSTARASGYNVWTGKTSSFSGASVTLNAGQTTLIVMKGL